MNSHRSLLKVIPMIKPENWAAKDNGCVCFGEYVITNDDIKERLALLAPLQRPPQSTMEAMDILSGDSKYIAVSTLLPLCYIVSSHVGLGSHVQWCEDH